IAAAMVALASRLHPELSFRQGSAGQIPFPDGSFDAVVGNLVILHVGEPELVARESARVLGPNGGGALSTRGAPGPAPVFAPPLSPGGPAGGGPPPRPPPRPPSFPFAGSAGG